MPAKLSPIPEPDEVSEAEIAAGLDILRTIDGRLSRIEAALARCEPLLAEAERRMSTFKWRK